MNLRTIKLGNMKQLICLFDKWYDPEVFKYETYCTNNTLKDDNSIIREKIKHIADAKHNLERILHDTGKESKDEGK